AGSVLFLMLPIFLNYRELLAPENAALRRQIAILFVPLLLMWIRVLIPLPSWVGVPLLLHLVSPRRLVFAAGALMCLLSAVLLGKAPLRFPLVRVAIVSAPACISWLSLPIFTQHLPPWTVASLLDLSPIPIAATVYLTHRYWARMTKPVMAGLAML